ncbi:MAG: hypothetical protein Phog2KO_28960 [Phototrophicaceae bacterium]
MLKQHIGMDIHKHFVIIVGVDANHEVVLTSRRVSTKQLGDWAKKNLTETDEVTLPRYLFEQHFGEIRLYRPWRYPKSSFANNLKCPPLAKTHLTNKK